MQWDFTQKEEFSLHSLPPPEGYRGTIEEYIQDIHARAEFTVLFVSTSSHYNRFGDFSYGVTVVEKKN